MSNTTHHLFWGDLQTLSAKKVWSDTEFANTFQGDQKIFLTSEISNNPKKEYLKEWTLTFLSSRATTELHYI